MPGGGSLVEASKQQAPEPGRAGRARTRSDWKRAARTTCVRTVSVATLLLAGLALPCACGRRVLLDDLVEKDGVWRRGPGGIPFDGTAEARHADGSLRERASFRHGRRQGRREVWFANGFLCEVSHWKDGRKDGPFASNHENGRPRIRTGFRAGREDGHAREWLEDGRKRSLRHFVDGEPDGEWLEWRDGVLRLAATYRAGLLDGRIRSFAADGVPRLDCAFAEGRVHGSCRAFHPSGLLEWEARAEKGVHEGRWARWFEGGRRRTAGVLRDGKPEGRWESWHVGGGSRVTGSFRGGRLDGVWREWNHRGQLIEESSFVAGRLVRQLRWYADGTARLRAHRQGAAWSWTAYDPGGREVADRDAPLLRGLYPFLFASDVPVHEGPLGAAQSAALASVRRVSDAPLDVMDDTSDPRFVEFLANARAPGELGLPKLPLVVTEEEPLCTTFVTRNGKGEVLFAYNQDHKDQATLLLRSSPPGAWRSISVVQTPALSDDEGNVELHRFRGGTSLLRAPYGPVVGMNEKGVAISGMSADRMEAVADPRRPLIGYGHVLRLVLDHAASVDEAIELVERVSWSHAGGDHLMIADASGRSAIVEFHDDRTLAFPSRSAWRVATNTSVWGRQDADLRLLCRRYAHASKALEAKNGDLSTSDALRLLASLRMEGTLVTANSSVWNLTAREVRLVVARRYGEVHTFVLGKPKG